MGVLEFQSGDFATAAFGRRLRETRKAKLMEVQAFAALASVSEKSQRAYELGKTPPTVAYLYRLVEHGIDIGYILTGSRADNGIPDGGARLIYNFGRLSARERAAVTLLVMALDGQVRPPADTSIEKARA